MAQDHEDRGAAATQEFAAHGLAGAPVDAASTAGETRRAAIVTAIRKLVTQL